MKLISKTLTTFAATAATGLGYPNDVAIGWAPLQRSYHPKLTRCLNHHVFDVLAVNENHLTNHLDKYSKPVSILVV